MHPIKFLTMILIFLNLVGCSSTSIDQSTLPATQVGPTIQPPAMVTNGTLTLVIETPTDKTVVHEPQLEVLGSVSIDAVLSLKGEKHILPPGSFTFTVTLEPGENILDFQVSSLFGNEVDLILTVIYQP